MLPKQKKKTSHRHHSLPAPTLYSPSLFISACSDHFSLLFSLFFVIRGIIIFFCACTNVTYYWSIDVRILVAVSSLGVGETAVPGSVFSRWGAALPYRARFSPDLGILANFRLVSLNQMCTNYTLTRIVPYTHAVG